MPTSTCQKHRSSGRELTRHNHLIHGFKFTGDDCTSYSKCRNAGGTDGGDCRPDRIRRRRGVEKDSDQELAVPKLVGRVVISTDRSDHHVPDQRSPFHGGRHPGWRPCRTGNIGRIQHRQICDCATNA